jgi:hypothetical protein
MFKNFSPAVGLLAGCGAVMLVALGLILANGTSNGGFLLLVVLCPLMHIFMRRRLPSGADRYEAGTARKSRKTDLQEEGGYSRIPAQE